CVCFLDRLFDRFMGVFTVGHRMAALSRGTRGAEVLEFSLVLLLFLFLAAGIIDMGFLFNNYRALTNAAREGARVAIVPGATDTDIRDRVKQYLQAHGMNPGSVTTTITPVQIVLASGLVNGE